MDKNATFSASVATATLLVYVVFATLPVHFAVIFSLFLVANAAFLWMVFRVLTDTSVPVDKKFEEYFYQDEDVRRR
jgi:hypothetical protein